MKPELTKEFREFVESLDINGVKYVLVGGYAVAWHGHPRLTKDIDFFVEKSPANAAAIVRAIDHFGMSSLGFRDEDFLEDGGIYFGNPPFRIDVLNFADGITFEEAWTTRIVGEWDGIRINVLSRDLLLQNKRATGRPEDLADVAKLVRRAPR